MSASEPTLTPETIPAYLRAVPRIDELLDPDDVRDVRSVSDGNLNVVFVVKDGSGRGVVVKQAPPYVRSHGPEWPMTPDRARHEAESMVVHSRLAPEFVPVLYRFDANRFVLVMEDLSDHQVWRTATNEGESHEGAATDMGTYVARVAFGSSVLGMPPEDQKAAIAESVNPALCEITENLVFTEPYVDAGRNSVIKANEKDARELAEDAAMVTEMGLAKFRFMTSAQAMIHGDLHTGSVMVRAEGVEPRSTKAFDSEFSFYGPIGFDIGALWANYVIAAARAYALGEDDRAAWLLGLLDETWTAFEEEFWRLWPRRHDPRVFPDAFLVRLLDELQRDAAVFAAAKMARRIVGAAKNSDTETLPEELREGAARGVLQAARAVAVERHVDASPNRTAEVAGNILVSTRTNRT